MQINQKFNAQDQVIFNWLLIGCLTILYAPAILHWYDGWLNKSISIEHEYFSHGMIGLPLAAYIVWNGRHHWQKLPNRSAPIGGFLLGLGAVFYLTPVADLVYLSFPLVLTGLCLWLKGIQGLKLQAFPLVLVWLATPNFVPYLITPYTLPLQQFIAATAGFLLLQLGLDVQVDQIYLSVNGNLVEVAPYCAGLKMLFTSLYVALILLYWSNSLGDRRKVILLMSGAVFFSVTANILRNATLSYFHGIGRADLFEWLHDSWGGDLYSAIMLGMIVLLNNFLDRQISDQPVEIDE